MKVLVIDNYDSFVYNLVHIIRNLGSYEIEIVKNDEVNNEQLESADKILLSPGPGIPKNAGRMPEIISKYHQTKSILGICLGHQALGEYFGFSLKNLPSPLHGISSELKPKSSNTIFHQMPESFQIGHYHSWVIEGKETDEIEILAYDDFGNIMAIQHKKYSVFGFQFHPESVLTEQGHILLNNWLTNSQ